MNLFTAVTQYENSPIGNQSWYPMVPLILLSFPAGTQFDPVMTCKEFLQHVMSLDQEKRARILNMEIPVVAEQVEDAKRSGHKSMLLAIVGMALIASVLILGGYFAATAHVGGTADSTTIGSFFDFVKEIAKMAFEMLAGQPGA
jgi:hypothetical protein